MSVPAPPEPSPTGPADAGDPGSSTVRPRRTGTVVAVVVAVVALVAAGILLAGRGGEPGEITVAGARAGESTGQAAAVYVDLTPSGDDTLLTATSPAAAQVSLHEAEVTDGLTTMALTDELPLPAGETTELRPGGSHLMLENLTRPLEPGDRIEVTLEFARAGERTVEVPVVGLAELVEGP